MFNFFSNEILKVVKELLTQVADGQLRATFGTKADTALHAAARRRDVDLVRLIVDAGANVDSKNVCFPFSVRYSLR